MYLQIIYNMQKEDLALNNLQGLICNEIQPDQLRLQDTSK